jgi:hypothetical protein
MCDIIDFKCAKRGCNRVFNIHLGSGNTKADEIKVFCGDHIPQKGVIVYYVKEHKFYDIVVKDKRVKSGIVNRQYYRPTGKEYIMAIKPLTGNAWKNHENNHPNELRTKVIEYRLQD